MATSGAYRGPTADNGRVYVNWQLYSQSQSGNYSTIKWQFGWEFLGSPTDRALENGYVYIEGVRYDVPGDVRDYPLGRSGTGLYQVASGQFNITHDADGYKTITVNADLTGYSGAVSNGSNVDYALTRIPKPPDAPGTPTAVVSENTADLDWAAAPTNGTAVTSYTVQRALSSTFGTGLASYNTGLTRSRLFTGLSYNETYYFRVYASSAAGNSQYSGTRTVVIGDHEPNAPGTPAATAITPISAQLDWSAATVPTGASAVTGYELEVRSTAYTGTPTHTIGNVTTLDLTGLVPATTYNYRVRAVNGGGSGAWAYGGTFTTLPSLYVPNATLDGWDTATPHMVVNGAWVPVQLMVPDGSENGVQTGTPTTWV